jgi:hypothetical protein
MGRSLFEGQVSVAHSNYKCSVIRGDAQRVDGGAVLDGVLHREIGGVEYLDHLVKGASKNLGAVCVECQARYGFLVVVGSAEKLSSQNVPYFELI